MTAEDRGAPFRKAVKSAGYKSVKAFCEAARITLGAGERMARNGQIPKDDAVTYRVAGLLDVAPTDLWPDWQPCRNPFAQAIYDAGFETLSDFGRAANVPQSVVNMWVNNGTVPRYDETILKAAELLRVEPTVLWPTWTPRPTKNQSKQRTLYGIDVYPDRTKMRMDEMRRNANVYVGQRFVMTYVTKEGKVRRPGTVVECAEHWFRIQYDSGWCECFHYQCRVGKECVHFRPEEKERKEA